MITGGNNGIRLAMSKLFAIFAVQEQRNDHLISLTTTMEKVT